MLQMGAPSLRVCWACWTNRVYALASCARALFVCAPCTRYAKRNADRAAWQAARAYVKRNAAMAARLAASRPALREGVAATLDDVISKLKRSNVQLLDLFMDEFRRAGE